MPKMHGFLGTSSVLVIALLCAASTYAFTSEEEISMQLSRAELVRLAGYGEDRLSSVLVTGTLLCYACLPPDSHLLTLHVPGARIGVACRTNDRSTMKTNWTLGKTDELGEFMVDLPSHLHATPRLEDNCMVRVLDVPKHLSSCRSIPGKRFRGLKISSIGNSIRVYSAGTLHLKSAPSHGQCSEKREDDMEEGHSVNK